MFLIFLLKRELVKGIIYRHPEIQPSNDLKDLSSLLMSYMKPRMRWAFCKCVSVFFLHFVCVWRALYICSKSRRGCAFSPSWTNHLLIPVNKNCPDLGLDVYRLKCDMFNVLSIWSLCCNSVDYNYPTPNSTVFRTKFYEIILVFFSVATDLNKHPPHCIIKLYMYVNLYIMLYII